MRPVPRAVRRRLTGILLAAACLVAGCWGQKELNQIALVLGVAVDKGEEKPIRVTLSVARPVAMGTSEPAPSGHTAYLVSREGETVMQAVRSAALELPRHLFWAHTKVILLGQPLAEEGIVPVLDVFLRNREIRRQVFIYVTKGPALPVLAAGNPLEAITSRGLAAQQGISQLGHVRLRDLVATMTSGLGHPFIIAVALNEAPPVEASGPPGSSAAWPSPVLAGIALLRHSRLELMLGPEEARYLLWLRGMEAPGVLVTRCPDELDQKITVEVSSLSRTVKVAARPGGRLSLDVAVTLEGAIGEQQCPHGATTPAELLRLEGELSRELQRDLTALVKRLQAHRLDPLGMGNKAHRSYPQLYPRVLDRWEKTWSAAQVSVSASVHIVRSGLIKEPSTVLEEELPE